MSLADIVVPTLQEGHELLPMAGDWKFFPLPEFRSTKVDLGSQANRLEASIGSAVVKGGIDSSAYTRPFHS
jgi:hypothetical protein